ncbi:MAG: guanylate kinase [Chloroflexota bacterium]|nr:guanylate kinase [Dehalococcoidia bacterium]MDW8254480.1 guanylate kinase [Chloroflexota bacterium]
MSQRRPDVDAVLTNVGRSPVLAVLSGPSGVGKDTILACLARTGHDFVRVVTYTTRPRAAHEQHGVDYWFIEDPQEYQRLLAEDALIEHANVYGYDYGVPRKPIEEALSAGRDVLLRIDVQGALTIKSRIPSAVLIFLAAPSLAAQEARLRQRGRDDEETIRRRLATAERELQLIDAFHYVIISRDGAPEAAAEEIRAILIAERHRVQPGRPLDELRAFRLVATTS